MTNERLALLCQMKPRRRRVRMLCIYYQTQKHVLRFGFMSVESLSLDCAYTVNSQFTRILVTKLRPYELLL